MPSHICTVAHLFVKEVTIVPHAKLEERIYESNFDSTSCISFSLVSLPHLFCYRLPCACNTFIWLISGYAPCTEVVGNKKLGGQPVFEVLHLAGFFSSQCPTFARARHKTRGTEGHERLTQTHTHLCEDKDKKDKKDSISDLDFRKLMSLAEQRRGHKADVHASNASKCFAEKSTKSFSKTSEEGLADAKSRRTLFVDRKRTKSWKDGSYVNSFSNIPVAVKPWLGELQAHRSQFVHLSSVMFSFWGTLSRVPLDHPRMQCIWIPRGTSVQKPEVQTVQNQLISDSFTSPSLTLSTGTFLWFWNRRSVFSEASLELDKDCQNSKISWISDICLTDRIEAVPVHFTSSLHS